MAKNGCKMAIYELLIFNFFFLQNWKNGNKTKIVIYVIDFDPIQIFIGWAHQNECQILSFMEAIDVVGEKMTGNGPKMSNS